MIDLSRATGEWSGITVGSSAGDYVLDLVPADHRRIEIGMDPGEFETAVAARLGMDARLFASHEALRRAEAGATGPAVDNDENGGPMRCVAVPLPLPGGGAAAVWSMVAGTRVPLSTVETTRRAALTLAAQLPRPRT